MVGLELQLRLCLADVPLAPRRHGVGSQVADPDAQDQGLGIQCFAVTLGPTSGYGPSEGV